MRAENFVAMKMPKSPVRQFACLSMVAVQFCNTRLSVRGSK